MHTDKSKSTRIRLKSSDSSELLHRNPADYLFQPIELANDLPNHRKPPSPFQTGLRYLKKLGQVKRQNENVQTETKSTILERTSPFSINYYAPLPSLSSHLTNKSIQVDDFDDVSYKTALNSTYSYLSFCEVLFILISILSFISIILFLQFSSHPLHCLLHKRYWYPMSFPHGFQCEKTNIELHYVEIDSKIYQLEIQKNIKSMNCLNVDILSCLPIDYSTIPKGRIVRRNDQLIQYCNHTQKIVCNNDSLQILPYEYKWNLKNTYSNTLTHCSCLTHSKRMDCFHFMISNQCDLYIPWLDYCLKYSSTHLTCQAYVKKF